MYSILLQLCLKSNSTRTIKEPARRIIRIDLFSRLTNQKQRFQTEVTPEPTRWPGVVKITLTRNPLLNGTVLNHPPYILSNPPLHSLESRSSPPPGVR